MKKPPGDRRAHPGRLGAGGHPPVGAYRKAIGHEAARDELCKWAGQQFDALAVDAFLHALDARNPAHASQHA